MDKIGNGNGKKTKGGEIRNGERRIDKSRVDSETKKKMRMERMYVDSPWKSAKG